MNTGGVIVKICGITSGEDAQAAVKAGADALGFMFYSKSSRNISPEKAAHIIKDLPSSVRKVGVFVDAPPEEIKNIISISGIDTVQLHGSESPKLCGELEGVTIYKAFRIKDQTSLESLQDYCVSAWLLDSYVPGTHGGTGETFNWDIAVQAASFGTPIILAGGLTPENVRAAVSKVKPYGVDVSSGVESSPGKKDPRKIEQFIQEAKSAVIKG